MLQPEGFATDPAAPPESAPASASGGGGGAAAAGVTAGEGGDWPKPPQLRHPVGGKRGASAVCGAGDGGSDSGRGPHPKRAGVGRLSRLGSRVEATEDRADGIGAKVGGAGSRAALVDRLPAASAAAGLLTTSPPLPPPQPAAAAAPPTAAEWAARYTALLATARPSQEPIRVLNPTSRPEPTASAAPRETPRHPIPPEPPFREHQRPTALNPEPVALNLKPSSFVERYAALLATAEVPGQGPRLRDAAAVALNPRDQDAGPARAQRAVEGAAQRGGPRSLRLEVVAAAREVPEGVRRRELVHVFCEERGSEVRLLSSLISASYEQVNNLHSLSVHVDRKPRHSFGSTRFL